MKIIKAIMVLSMIWSGAVYADSYFDPAPQDQTGVSDLQPWTDTEADAAPQRVMQQTVSDDHKSDFLARYTFAQK